MGKACPLHQSFVGGPLIIHFNGIFTHIYKEVISETECVHWIDYLSRSVDYVQVDRVGKIAREVAYLCASYNELSGSLKLDSLPDTLTYFGSALKQGMRLPTSHQRHRKAHGAGPPWPPQAPCHIRTPGWFPRGDEHHGCPAVAAHTSAAHERQ